jgi:hypothetical protein
MKKVLFLIVSFIVVVFAVRFYKSNAGCDVVVYLRNGDEVKCRWVNTYVSGYSNLHTCDGEDIPVYTNEIKYIK